MAGGPGAAQLGQPAYCVFTDKTLMAIAEAVPGDEGELAGISGVGGRKLDRFGADVLAICAGRGGSEGDESRRTEYKLVGKIVCACPGIPIGS